MQFMTRADLVHLWSVWKIQLMVLLSFVLQFFLFVAGCLRHHVKTNIFFRFFIWLAYVGADLVAVYALGLISQYENKDNCGRDLFGGMDPLVFLWVPFLLIHLGGQDTITAFSVEDNNLWLRHMLNLIVQVTLAMYAFWNSMGQINMQLMASGIFIFVAGIIKYGERTWALKCGSQESLQSSCGDTYKQLGGEKSTYSSRAAYALQTVLFAQGLFAGLNVLYLEQDEQIGLLNGFAERKEEMKNIVQLELGMMYGILYTKAMVLRTWIGCILRCVAHISMMVSFVIFLVARKHSHSRVNVAITYTLFIGAHILNVCAIVMIILSPWTWAWVHLIKRPKFVCCWPPNDAMSCVFRAIRAEERSWLIRSMGQFNLVGSSIRDRSTPALISKMIAAFGSEKLWRKLWHVEHIHAQEMVECFVKWFCRASKVEELFSQPLHAIERNGVFVNQGVNVRSPLQDSIILLHLFTDWSISRLPLGSSDEDKALAEECEKLSNYMMYLLAVHPSMLPVNFPPARDCLTSLSFAVELGTKSKQEILDSYAPPFNVSLLELKEAWMRLLCYAAGKCRGEEHARRLGDGGELLTLVWLLMLHHGLGDVAGRELDLLPSSGLFRLDLLGATILTGVGSPLYAFPARRTDISNDDSSVQIRLEL